MVLPSYGCSGHSVNAKQCSREYFVISLPTLLPDFHPSHCYAGLKLVPIWKIILIWETATHYNVCYYSVAKQKCTYVSNIKSTFKHFISYVSNQYFSKYHIYSLGKFLQPRSHIYFNVKCMYQWFLDVKFSRSIDYCQIFYISSVNYVPYKR